MSNRRILANLSRLAASAANVIVRIPVVPGVNDDPANLHATGRFVADVGSISEVHLLPYHRAGLSKYERLGMDYTLEDTPEPTSESMESLAAIVREYGLGTKIGG